MSFDPSFNSPVLNYVGSVDVASATSGATLYNILFDSSLCTVGNVLMFEYKIQPANVLIPNPTDITLGYVNIENANPSGICNQWTITVPAYGVDYNPEIDREISVRVYSGLTGISEIAVSPWSNSLAVHVPPARPLIDYAVFNQNISPGDDDLWIYLRIQPTYDYDELTFIVAYYFQEATTGNTAWQVTDPLTATLVTDPSGNDLRQLEVSNIGNVDPSTNVVYLGVYAVYRFVYNGENYYSVSEISTTYTATPASNLNAPTIMSIDYNVYNTPSTQNMIVNWIAPAITVLPTYVVDSYTLQLSLNSGSWSTVSSTIPSSDLSYNYDVSSYGCSNNLAFRVYAQYTTGAQSNNSNEESLNIFKYSLAPQNLDVISVLSPDFIDFTFENPSDIGCGDGYQFVVEFNGNSGDISYNIPYDPSATTYDISYSGLNIGNYGDIILYLQTQDTNSSNYLDGASTTSPFIITTFTLDDIDYKVYTDNTQNMVLTWNDPIDSSLIYSGWEVIDYDIYLNGNLIDTVTDLTYTYLATEPCGSNLAFYIEANLNNSGTQFSIRSNTEDINIFKYSLAPQNLDVISASPGFIDFTFENPSDIGCGDGYQFVVELNGDSGDISYNIPYDPSATTYDISYSGLNIGNYGDVTLYLQTQDTNSSNYLDGASTTTPFIMTTLTLDDIDYKVYTDNTQNMVLTWNDPIDPYWIYSGWEVISYDIYLNGNLIDTVTDLTYTFDASSYDCSNNLAFYIEANLNNSGTDFTIKSNTESINIFKYADAPSNVSVAWASDLSNTILDIGFTFTVPYPYNSGCGAIVNWKVTVTDASGTEIYDSSVNYVEGQTNYVVYLNDVPYIPVGNVNVFMQTIDTNSTDYMDGAIASDDFIATDVPIFIDVVINPTRTLLTFDVITQVLLGQTALFAWVDISGATVTRNQVNWYTNSVVPTQDPETGVYIYSFIYDHTAFGTTGFIPNHLTLLASNNPGIGFYNTLNS